MADDLKFSQAVLDQSYRDVVSRVKTTSLKGIAEAFEFNVDRVVALLKSPGVVYLISSCIDKEIRETARRVHTTSDRLIDEPKVINDPKFRSELYKSFDSKLPDILRRTNAHTEEAWREMSVSIEQILRDLETPLQTGVGAIFSGAIIGTWTAFETLAGDLWVAAINAHPAGLAELSGPKNRIVKIAGTRLEKSEEEQEKPATSMKSIPITITELQKITDGSYNLSDKMGTILKGKFKFSAHGLGLVITLIPRSERRNSNVTDLIL